MNVSLIGMPGAGKSTVGVLLAKRLGYDFLDTDLLIQRREGALLQTVLDRLGTERFLDAEAEVIAALDCRNTVIAPGGSAVLRELGAKRLKQLGPVVFLDLPCEALERRLGDLATRGVTLEPGQTLRGLYEYRRPFYEKYADFTVNAHQPTIEHTVEEVLNALRQL